MNSRCTLRLYPHIATDWLAHQRMLYLLMGLLGCEPVMAAPVDTAVAQLDAALSCMAASEPTFNAVITADDAVARESAIGIDLTPDRFPLGGMPILIKDNIETSHFPTTAGSLLLSGNHTDTDAPLVMQLRAAGALILGKANLSEWANFRSQHSSSGWSGVGGQTVNAMDTTRTPCGSSSGSAVAVARGYVRMAVGTETSGSIVCPAAANGVVGFKPTHGLVSGEGIIPLAATQDTAGPIADSVTTAARGLAAMANPDVAATPTIRNGLDAVKTLTSFKDLRIGVWRESLGYDPRRDAALRAVINTLREDGATIVEDVAIARYPDFNKDSYNVLLYEFKRDIASYLQGTPAGVTARTVDDLIAQNEGLAARELAVFDQSIFLDAQALNDDEAAYQARLARIRKAMRDDGLDKVFATRELDAIIGTTSSLPWKIDAVNGDAWFGSGMASPAAIAGNPHITLPLAEVAGLPLGISLYGQRWQDHRLAQIAYRLEQLHPAPAYAWPAGRPEAFSPDCRSQ